MVLSIFGVNCTIALDISCVFWQERAYFPSSSQNQVLLCLWYYCFLSSQFLVVENYELSKSTNHHLSVSLTLEFFRTLTWFISFFYFNCLPDYVLCKLFELVILVSTHFVTNHLIYHKKLRYPTSFFISNFILEIKIVGKIFHFSSATFWFWGVNI